MSESGGRRIKRSIYLDVNSVKFCSVDMIERFSHVQILSEYVDQKMKELKSYNEIHAINESVIANGRRMTNIGTFRAYLIEYLRSHPKIHQDMTFLVRQLAPTDRGLPVEIYVFSNDQRWPQYEAIQADIFDHVYAVLSEFDLRPFQNPSGSDIERSLKNFSDKN